MNAKSIELFEIEINEVEVADDENKVPKAPFKPAYKVDLTKYSLESYNIKPNSTKSLGGSITKAVSLEKGHAVATAPLSGAQKALATPEFLRVADRATPKGDFEGCLREVLTLSVKARVAMESFKGLCAGMDEDTFSEAALPVISRFYGLSLRRSGTGKLMITAPEKGTEKFRAYEAARQALHRIKKELFSKSETSDKKASGEIKPPEPTEEVDPVKLQEVAEAFLNLLRKHDADKKLATKALSLALKARG
jgi:hypothetical protein